MKQYNHPVNVPIRVDALWSDSQTKTVTPTTAFTQLQSTVSSSGNFSNAGPWLGDTVRPAFNDQPPLAAGLHLHWTLPQALRHGTTVYVLDYTVFNELVQQGVPCALVQSLKGKATIGAELTLDALTGLLNSLAPSQGFKPLSEVDFNPGVKPTPYAGLISSASGVEADSYTPADLSWDPIFLELYGPMIVQAAARMKLPPVPNRWLILRAGGDGDPSAWVVESDRLSTPDDGDGSAPAGAGPTAVPGQFTSEFVSASQSVTLSNAIQYLGLTTKAGDWHEHDEPGDKTPILSPLTAAGPGLVDFAAFYPNCQGVFGFCDATADDKTTYTYTIIGWFSDRANDPATSDYNVAPWASLVSDVAGRLASLGWQVPTDPAIDGSVYTAKISVTGSKCPAQGLDKPMTGVKVAVGNTAGEALAAYLAKSDTSTAAWGLTSERLLDAAQAGALRRVLEADGPAVVEQALHEQAFHAKSGGSRWEIAPQAPAQPGLSPQPTPLPPLSSDVETALSALNAAQLQFDRTQAYLTAQRRLLFTDWCRALHLETDDSGSNENADPNGSTRNPGGGTSVPLDELSATLVNQSAEAVDAAGMGNGDNNLMLGFWAAKALYLAHAAALNALAQMTGGARYTLERRAAPRFYQANDPALLLCDEEGSSSLTTSPADSLPTVPGRGGDNENLLSCTVVTAGDSPAAGLPDTWPDGPTTYCVASVQSSIQAVQGAQSWRPISLTWEVQCYPYPGAGAITGSTADGYSVTGYKPSFITDSFHPDPAGVDLIAKTGVKPDPNISATYNGRVILSDHANTTLRARILQLTGENTSPPPDQLDTRKLPGALRQQNVADLLSNAYASKTVTLSQSLDGFNDRLLMLRRIPQTSLFDCGYANAGWMVDFSPQPTWDPDSQSFYPEVGRQHEASPQQGDVYSPIRAGKCVLTNLWLVDAFGQTQQWSVETNNVTIASSLPDMTAPGNDAVPAFLLPPRLAQPSRLLFRWVAADGSGVESADQASTSPICGWVMLNRIDESLMFFTKEGALLGWVSMQDGTSVAWAPNTTFPPPSTDPLLEQVIKQAQAAPGKMYDDIATALLTIEPRAHRQHRASSVLFSRPLALASATLRLDVQGGPAPHQGYEWLATMPLDDNQEAITSSYCPVQAAGGVTPASPFPQRETCAFEKVTFPVRLGDVSMDDDGLVAYWTVDRGNIAISYNLVDPADGNEPTLGMTADPTATPITVLLLLDPRAPVHAVSGILPTKVIDIPPEMFTGAVKNMTLLLTVGPVLSPTGVDQPTLSLIEAEPPLLPVPAEIRGGWSWTEEGTTASLAMTGQIDDRAHLSPRPPVLRAGWLCLPGGK
ncbi:uncharacterized protein SOCE26_078360 [Sorangium cellulosum]|uniref:Uncharacterized protein n=1 Tax=Sorangium cellulosum TaxID=56 RepID=A0A2L0F498_SORCE|nr:hypothetical protein [Sorangium cellulosum]AUX46331.1 uncharacterized protein SOCE26_078360 [Sorangium cellulosum]